MAGNGDAVQNLKHIANGWSGPFAFFDLFRFLHDPVQLLERGRRGHSHLSPDHRTDLEKTDLQLQR